MLRSSSAHMQGLLGLCSRAQDNYWAHTLKLLKPPHPRVHAWQQEKPLQWQAYASKQPNTAKNKFKKNFLKKGLFPHCSWSSPHSYCFAFPEHGLFLSKMLIPSCPFAQGVSSPGELPKSIYLNWTSNPTLLSWFIFLHNIPQQRYIQIIRTS